MRQVIFGLLLVIVAVILWEKWNDRDLHKGVVSRPFGWKPACQCVV